MKANYYQVEVTCVESSDKELIIRDYELIVKTRTRSAALEFGLKLLRRYDSRALDNMYGTNISWQGEQEFDGIKITTKTWETHALDSEPRVNIKFTKFS